MRILFISILSIALICCPPAFLNAQQNARISLDIKGMDILDVLKILSMRSDLNIIAGRNVRGNVTMFLKDVDIWDAFEIILAANELAYEKRGDIINVMTQRDYELLYGEKYQDRRQVKTIKLKYARAEDVSAALSQIKTNIGKVVVDEPSKSVVLMDVPYKIEEMEKIIESLDSPVVTKVYELQYAKAADLKDKITEMLTKNIGSMRLDERTNKVVITDIERKITEFDKVIAAFDDKHKEVEIEAMILELTLNDEYQAGIDWDVAFQKLGTFLSKKFGDQTFGASFSRLGTILPATSSATTQKGFAYQIGDVGTKGFQTIVEFLQVYGRTNILSNPRITVLNNEEAKILVGKNQPYVTTTVSQGETTSQTAASVTYIDLGVKLTVTPAINKDGFITMKVKPEISSSSTNVEYTISTGVTNTVPVVETSSTETTVMAKDKNTIILSGLIQKRDEIETKKIPGLGDIPILGNLFKSTKRGNLTQSGSTTTSGEPERKEIIIFLTPRIVSGENERFVERVKEEDDKEKKDRQIQRQIDRFSETEYEGDLEEVIGPSDYHKAVWQKVNERIIANRPIRPIAGEVSVSFVVMPDGNLAEKPAIFALPDTDPKLIKIALDSVETAAPFPPFPSSIDKDSETFNINISYE